MIKMRKIVSLLLISLLILGCRVSHINTFNDSVFTEKQEHFTDSIILDYIIKDNPKTKIFISKENISNKNQHHFSKKITFLDKGDSYKKKLFRPTRFYRFSKDKYSNDSIFIEKQVFVKYLFRHEEFEDSNFYYYYTVLQKTDNTIKRILYFRGIDLYVLFEPNCLRCPYYEDLFRSKIELPNQVPLNHIPNVVPHSH
jgi:hypothetical protein